MVEATIDMNLWLLLAVTVGIVVVCGTRLERRGWALMPGFQEKR